MVNNMVDKNYDSMKNRINDLENQVVNLKYLLSFAGVRSLDMLAEDFNLFLLNKSKKIAAEFNKYPVGNDERQTIETIIKNLNKCSYQFKTLLK